MEKYRKEFREKMPVTNKSEIEEVKRIGREYDRKNTKQKGGLNSSQP